MSKAEGSEGPGFVDKIRALAGLLVAAFAGVLNFIGLRSDELSTVLRNEPGYSALVFGLLTLGILIAVASIFTASTSDVTAQQAYATAALTIALGGGVFALLAIHQSNSEVEITAGAVVFLLGVFFAGYCLIATRPNRDKLGAGSRQTLFIIVAVGLTAIATFAGLRLETVSQLQHTAPIVTPKSTQGADVTTIAIVVGATRLARSDRVNVAVFGLETGTDPHTVCGSVSIPDGQSPTCAEAPCYVGFDYSNDGNPLATGCVYLSYGNYQPSDIGKIDQTVAFQVPTGRYDRIDVVGRYCVGDSSSSSACKFTTQTATTYVDLSLPSNG